MQQYRRIGCMNEGYYKMLCSKIKIVQKLTVNYQVNEEKWPFTFYAIKRL